MDSPASIKKDYSLCVRLSSAEVEESSCCSCDLISIRTRSFRSDLAVSGLIPGETNQPDLESGLAKI